jgi:hypothetical protein
MEELIFFAVIIFLSIIESVARSRKKRSGGPLPEAPPEWEQLPLPRPRPRAEPRPQPRPLGAEIPSHDSDPSFDMGASAEVEPSFDDTRWRELEKGRATSSESMIPSDIWDEIAGLAREPERQEPSYTPPRRPAPKPGPAPHPKRMPTPARPTAKVEPRRTPSPAPKPKRVTILAPEPAPEGAPEHAVHGSHVGYGTDPSARGASAQDRLDPLVRELGQDAAAVRLQLRGRGVHALRQALILQEVLGPPAAERPDRF